MSKTAGVKERRPLRLLIALLALVTIAAAGVRIAFERGSSTAPLPPILLQAREQMALAPVLAAEAAVRARPDDATARVALAGACARTGDPVGAALALHPMVMEQAPLAAPAGLDLDTLLSRYAGYCTQAGWLSEAGAALARVRPLPARPGLELASAWAARGERGKATALLDALEREGAPREADDWLDGAMTWYQCRRPQEAARWAERGIAADGGTPAARAVLARCRIAAGEPEAALAALEKAALGQSGRRGQWPVVGGPLRQNPPSTTGDQPPHPPLFGPEPGAQSPEPPFSDPLLAYWRARAGLRCADPRLREESRRWLAHHAAHEAPDPAAAFEAGRAALAAGEAAAAAELLERAARAGYQEVLAAEELTRAYTALGRPVEAGRARARAAKARGRFAEAEAALRGSLRHDPAALEAAVELGQVLILAGKPAEALAALRAGRKRHPESLELALGEAEALYRLDRFAEQARVLEEAAARHPARAHEPLRALGRMYYETRQYDRAILPMERALRVSVDDLEAHRTLGLCHALRPEDPEHAEAALRHLLRAVAIEPDDHYPWTKAGGVLQRMGHTAEAEACYRRAIAWDSWAEAPYVPLARLLQQEGREAEAALLLRRYRGNRAFEQQRVPLENRLPGGQGNALTHYRMGDLLFRNVSFGRAYPYLLIAASLKPDWKEAQARLADACALLDYIDLWQEAERSAGSIPPGAGSPRPRE